MYSLKHSGLKNIYKKFLCSFQERHQGSSYPQPMAAKVPLVVLLGLGFLSRGLPLLCMLSRSSERLVKQKQGVKLEELCNKRKLMLNCSL